MVHTHGVVCGDWSVEEGEGLVVFVSALEGLESVVGFPVVEDFLLCLKRAVVGHEVRLEGCFLKVVEKIEAKGVVKEKQSFINCED